MRSEAALKGPNGVLNWNHPLQIGLDLVKRPLYFTIYDGDKISGTAEFVLAAEVARAQKKGADVADDGRGGVDSLECRLPVFGKGVQSNNTNIPANCAQGVENESSAAVSSSSHIVMVASFNRLP